MDFGKTLDNLLALRRERKPFPGAQRAAVVYGAGNRGRELRRLLNERGYRVERFVDQAADRTPLVDGLPCVHPQRPEARARGNEFALIGIWRPDIDLGPILGLMRELGYEETATVYDYVEAFGPAINAPYWQTRSGFYLEHLEDLRRLGNLFAEERSRQCLAEVLRLRLLGDTSVLAAPEAEAGYLPEGLIRLGEGARFIDGGAYDGDTFETIARRGVRLGSYVGLEPDPHNYQRLVARLREAAWKPPEVLLLPCAAWSHTRVLSFSADGSEGSAVSAGGSVSVQGIALDEALPGFPANMIKFDIEGAEPEALVGARDLIRRARPILAVAIYHQPDHLWQIPFLIEAWKLGYSFFLRYHQMGGNDLVVYCLPS